jgi:uncharacterized membrane protein YeaQ/YmgE (transglycosylase-associated protein family)
MQTGSPAPALALLTFAPERTISVVPPKTKEREVHTWDMGLLPGSSLERSQAGLQMDMVVGLVGALIGGFISSHLGLGGVGQHGLIMSIVIAVIGAVILTMIIRLISGNRKANL